jgi:hypothetical protein
VESAAIAGVVYSVLAIAALVLLRTFPESIGEVGALSTWFDDSANRWNLIIGMNLAAISSIAFLWFVAVIRRRMGEREDKFFSTVFLGSAILYVGIWLVGAAAVASFAFAFQRFGEAAIDPSSATYVVGFAEALILVVAPRLQGVFILSTSTLILHTEMLPKWLAYVGYLAGLAMLLIPMIYEPIGLGFPLWVLAVSVTIFISKSTHHLET